MHKDNSVLDHIIQSNYKNIAGIVVQKNGERVYENYFNGCNPASRLHIYSVTKSIVSLLVGIALDKGYIKSLDQKVLGFFPDYTIKKRESTIQNITLENLLTMTAPYKYKLAPYIKYFTSNNWQNFCLDLLGGKGQIGKFNYTPLIGPDILTGILTKVTGQSVFNFAQQQLFSPLGITVEKNLVFHTKEEQLAFNKSTHISGWVTDATGLNAAGWGLSLSPIDMAKIGQLCLDGGTWKGKQIVAKSWIEKSMVEHSRWKKLDMPYGYLWWIINQQEQAYAAMGDGGNVIYINTKKKLVVSIASLYAPNPKDRIKLIQEYIQPAFEK